MRRTYSYDNRSLSALAVGRLWKITDSSSATYFSCNSVGNVIRKRSVIGSKTFNTYYTYGNLGNVSRVTWQNSSTVKTVASNMTYKPMGPLKSMQYGNGLTRTLTYDLDYRLTKIDNGGVQNLSYLFDKNNNITQI